jgi:hypothetical protein
MDVHVNINPGAIGDKIEKAWKKALPKVVDEILKDVSPYVKKDHGALQASGFDHSVPREGKLVWETPYARRQYWEIQTAVKGENPKATWRWFEVAKAERMSIWERKIDRAVKNEL